ncbi:MAG: response regulator transcription factor [Rhodospirillaceae bacterium]|nr:response regulator transcription factor [Rhodospirillaceae bacterium]
MFTFTLTAAGEARAEARGHAAAPRPVSELGQPSRILVVDGDARMPRFRRDAPSNTGYASLLTGVRNDPPQIIRTERPWLVLLDLMLADVDGIELRQQVPELADLPVILISGYGRKETIAKARESGAGDYFVVPFAPTKLLAWVRAELRRREAPESFVLGRLATDYEQRLVTVRGKADEFTATEDELLRALSLDAERVVTFDTLLRGVWAKLENTDSNLVRILVRNLRRKLGVTAATGAYIFNQRGIGYCMGRSPDR